MFIETPYLFPFIMTPYSKMEQISFPNYFRLFERKKNFKKTFTPRFIQ